MAGGGWSIQPVLVSGDAHDLASEHGAINGVHRDGALEAAAHIGDRLRAQPDRIEECVKRSGITAAVPAGAGRCVNGDLLARAGQYELVEGRVLLADRSGGRVYLNFGRYWKEDFTAVIEAPALRLFAESGFDPLALEDALVRIRGWVDDRDGPRIEVTHPEQIEVLATR